MRSADEVADPLGWTLLGIQALGPLGELVELPLELLKLGDAGAKLGGVPLKQPGDVTARGCALVAEGDDLTDFAQREPERLCRTHEPQTAQRRPVVDAVAGRSPLRRGQD